MLNDSKSGSRRRRRGVQDQRPLPPAPPRTERSDTPDTYRAPAVQKAFELLKLVAGSPDGLSLSEIARQLGFSKGTTHGMLQALLRSGALEQAPNGKGFYLGPAVVDLAFRSWNYFRVAEQAQPMLDELRDRIGETVFLGVLSRTRGLIMATAEASKPLKISAPPGTSIPLLAGAVGKVFLAQLTDDQVKTILAEQGLPRYTKHSITERPRLLAELAAVRRRGYAVDEEEYLPGVTAVAVALGNRRGLPLAIWVVGFAEAMRKPLLAKIAAETLAAAAALRQALYERA